MSNRFFENQPNEICSHLSEKASQGRFVKPKKLQNHSNEEKGKEKKKERGEGKEKKRKKAMVALLKDPFCDNVFKNPAGCSWSLIGYSSCDGTIPFCGSTQILVPTHQVWTALKSLTNLTLISIRKYTNLFNFAVVIREGICKMALFYYYDQNTFVELGNPSEV